MLWNKSKSLVYFQVLLQYSVAASQLNYSLAHYHTALACVWAQLVELQTSKGQGQSLLQQLYDCEDMQANIPATVRQVNTKLTQGSWQITLVGGIDKVQVSVTPEQVPSGNSFSFMFTVAFHLYVFLGTTILS